MKKTLAILLALLMTATVALVSCENNGREPVGGDWDNDDEYEDGETDDESGDENESESDGESESNNDSSNTDIYGWTDAAGTVYAGVNDLALRKSTSSTGSGNIEKMLTAGESLTRISTNGTWDKISYNGKECYVQSKFVCESNANFTFTNCTEDVTLTFVSGKGALRLYTSPFEVYEGNTLLYNNVFQSSGFGGFDGTIKKLATSENGWLKVSVNGTLTVDKSTTTYTVENQIFYIDPNTAVSDRISDPQRPGGSSGGNING